MQSVIHQALNAYAQAAVDADVMTAHPHRLILMLFEAARVAIARARRHLASGETAAKGEAISKAIQIIDQGLKASLDVKAGGELAERLSALYEYMSRRLLVANQRNDGDALVEVARFLAELQEAWEAIAPGGGDSAPETSVQTLSVTG